MTRRLLLQAVLSVVGGLFSLRGIVEPEEGWPKEGGYWVDRNGVLWLQGPGVVQLGEFSWPGLAPSPLSSRDGGTLTWVADAIQSPQ